MDLSNPRVELGCRIVGSRKVANALMRDNFDPRLAEYRLPAVEKDDKDLTLEDVIGIASRYIHACDSTIGREIDPEFAPTIGGHVHALTITANGASWRPAMNLAISRGKGDDGARH